MESRGDEGSRCSAETIFSRSPPLVSQLCLLWAMPPPPSVCARGLPHAAAAPAAAASSNLFPPLSYFRRCQGPLLSWQQAAIGSSYGPLCALTHGNLTGHLKIQMRKGKKQTNKKTGGLWQSGVLNAWCAPALAPPTSAGILKRPYFVPFSLTFLQSCRFTFFVSFFLSVASFISMFAKHWMNSFEV